MTTPVDPAELHTLQFNLSHRFQALLSVHMVHQLCEKPPPPSPWHRSYVMVVLVMMMTDDLVVLWSASHHAIRHSPVVATTAPPYLCHHQKRQRRFQAILARPDTVDAAHGYAASGYLSFRR
jgi:hypothetical protein